jgi:hypothetical protein
MGFFSQNCNGCGHPALSVYAVNGINDWMMHVVVITPTGDIISGEYDGYGRVAGADYAVGSDNTVWHKACWTVAGKPMEYRGESKYADDQGYFFDDGDHNMDEPVLH